MGLRPNPTQRQRRLGTELRKLRDACGMNGVTAGAYAGLGPQHLGHIEAARTAIPEGKLRALLAAYGCEPKTKAEALVAMSQSTGKGWWSDYRKGPIPPAARDLAELEAMSASCRSFQWMHIPGLLQTAEYMRALFEGGQPSAPSDDIDTYTSFRQQRQSVLMRQDPPGFHAVIHEAALRMRMVSTDIMRRQIEHLVEMARLPHIRIQVLPFDAEVFPTAFGTPFVLFEHAVPELSTAYVEQPVSSPFISDQEQYRRFDDTFQHLARAALEPIDPNIEPGFYKKRDSLALIQHLLYTM
ncbi:helix-turn-helix transcriptional regulator [Streptomyces sp. UNOB3_S3]|uniref:helix-turn-helix domain-containing protein n=1 Tax=Streptomyces sp. UNOB3_S3 TaxID=2871682 RepID=UPI0023B090BD|nr:helix-turn-helix transcriptional regulator [Streptomyces sp. UNOB3_S3]MCC3777776.1 helix-turn-helix domain-containing protein [Streptomyces sp. UNOB3_S3]